MTDSVSFLQSTSSSANLRVGSKAGTASSGFNFKGCDTDHVSISSEGLRRQRESGQGSDSLTWEDLLDLENGVSTLDNGNKQVVTIDGSHVEILEYCGSVLVGKVEGELDSDKAELDSERYDVFGNLELSMHTTMEGLSANTLSMTSASMDRTIKWYDNGQLSRSMEDSTTLRSAYALAEYTEESLAEGYYSSGTTNSSSSGVSLFETSALDQLTASKTSDNQTIRYHASIREYDNGRLVQDMTIHQESKYANETNRSSISSGDMARNSTDEEYHEMSLRVHAKTYDVNGNLQHEVQFSEEQKDGSGNIGGKTKQSLSVSWYSEGELVRKSEGSLELEESERIHLGSRPSMLESLGISEGEYASSRPKSAGELLSVNYTEAATDPGYFSDATAHYVAMGSYYNPAERIAGEGALGRPYSVSWTDEIYLDGDMVSRQEDTESARKAPDTDEMRFRTGGGLTEDDTPELLHTASHTVESYDGGVKEQAAVKGREVLIQDDDGPTKLKSYVTESAGAGLQSQTQQKTIEGSLLEADGDFHTASEGCATEVELALDDMVTVSRRIEGGAITVD